MQPTDVSCCQTSLVLPGSANAIGGQGAIIKLRPTADRAPTGMLLENPYEKNTSVYDPSVNFRFLQMKYASGVFFLSVSIDVLYFAGTHVERTQVRMHGTQA